MDHQNWALPAQLVDAAFPFHIVLDEELNVAAAGSSIIQLHSDDIVGRRLVDLFTVDTPKVVATFDTFAKQHRSLFLLRSTAIDGLVLRGQMLFDGDARRLVFVGSPWVTETSMFASLGLTLDDFAVSDAVVDYVLLLQSQSTSLNEARLMAERLRETANQLSHQAYHDTLTGLVNRTRLLAQLQSALDRFDGTSDLAVLMMDLDGFKAVNDSFGHSAGDAVLEIIGKRLESVSRREDIIARFGGDEFAMVLGASRQRNATGPATADDVADRVLAAINEPLALPSNWGITVPLSVSIGIAHATGAESAEELLRNADLAMYAAKATGKSRHATFTPAMHAASVTRMDLAQQMRLALDRGQFTLMYQPVLRLQTNCFAGAEALLRWDHPKHGMLLPGEFLDIAEDTGLIVPIGAWVIDEACRELQVWQRAHHGAEQIGVAVNLSGRQFGPALVDTVRAALERYEIDPSSLTLEITEGLITGDASSANETVRALKNLGVWLSIDDFGTGHSSLGRLRQYDFDELKIDRQFVSDLDSGDPTLVNSQIALAHGLGLNVVAEGVETAAELDYLRAAGCNQAQGYLIARPLPREVIRGMLAGRGQWHGDAVTAVASRAEPVHREALAS